MNCSIGGKTGGKQHAMILHWFKYFLLIPLIFAYSCSNLPEKDLRPRAIRGVLDLSAWDFNENGTVDLSGDYEFYWKQLLFPEDFGKRDPSRKREYIKVPGYWNGFESEGKKITGSGYATYRLKVQLNVKDTAMALKVLDMGTAFTLFLNGDKVYSAGEVGKTVKSSKPQFNPKVIDFQITKNQLDLIIHVSNFHHRKGGAWEPIVLGTEEQIRRIRETELCYELFLFGSILIMAIYHFGLFALRRKDPSTLFFGIFCLLIALRILTTGERYLIHLWPIINWEILAKLEYLSYYLAIPAFAQFFSSVFQQRLLKKICNAAAVLSLVFSLLVIVLPLKYYSHTLTPYHLLTLMMFVYGICVLVVLSSRKNYDAVVFLAGFVILFLTAINDMLHNESLIETGQLIPLGLFAFIFSQAFLISLRFSRAFATVESQRKRLGRSNQAIKKGIKKRIKAEKALKESHERFLTVLDSIYADIYVADMSTYEILFMNQHMKNSFGHDFTGQIYWKAFRKDSKACIRCNNDKLLDSEGRPNGIQIWECENPITGKWYKNYDRAIKWDNDRFVRLQIAMDVTEQKLAEQTLQKAKDELEILVRMRTADLLKANEDLSLEIEERKQAQEIATRARQSAEIANRAKSEFLANMSHELRTPLNHILGFTELVVDKSVGELNETQEEYLNDVLNSSNHLLSVINDILDLSKVESGKMELDLSEFDLKEFLDHSLRIIKDRAMKHGLKLSMKRKNLPETLKADKRKLKQVLYNLISNAVKFTPDGGSILLSAERINGTGVKAVLKSKAVSPGNYNREGEFIKVSVADSGIGLNTNNLDRIFNPFEQADNSASRKFQGTGLGLSLTRSLVKLHKGWIWAESEGEGQGSTFSFVIPILGEKLS